MHATLAPRLERDRRIGCGKPEQSLGDLAKRAIELDLRRGHMSVKRAIHANIGQVDLGRVRVPVPSKDEQRAIAQVIEDADRAPATLRRLIRKKRELRIAVARQLLTGDLRLPGFVGEWTRMRLGQLGSFSKGAGIRKDQVSPEGVPCVRYGEIYTHHDDRVREFNSFISRSVAAESRRIVTGDLLFAASGETAEEIGKCVAYLGAGEAYAGGDIVILSPTKDDPLFLAYLMNQEHVARQKMRLGQGDAVVHIAARALGQIELSLPTVEEQRSISTVIAEVDEEIIALEALAAKNADLATGIAQELLSGRTRLT